MLRRQFFVVFVSLSLGLSSAGSVWSQDNEKRGFDAESVYDVGEIDTVSLFSGGLSIVIPIGNEYPVNGLTSYGLSLVYNSKLWDYRTVQRLPSGNFERISIPTRHVNAGFGWSLNPGFLIEEDGGSENPHEWNHWQYVSPDGARHYFYPTLHRGENDGNANVYYTRDNSYLRLNLTSVPYTVEFPNGEIHEFGYEEPTPSGQGNKWYVTRMTDVFNQAADQNVVDIGYGPKVDEGEWVWTISDSHNRVHTVTLLDLVSNDDDPDDDLYYVTDIELETFEGVPATYSFEYTFGEIQAGCGADFQENGFDVWFLTRLTLPEGATYEMLDGAAPRYRTSCGGGGESGAIDGIRLPPRGQIEWDYASFEMPFYNELAGANLDPITETQGVRLRRTLDEDDNLLGQWSYQRELFPFWQPGGDRPTEVQVHVEDPNGYCTKHYFDANPGYTSPMEGDNPNPGQSYGLPFSWDQTVSNGRHLSKQVYAGTRSAGFCDDIGKDPLRSTYVTYEHDEIGLPSDTPAGPILEEVQDSNRRIRATRTVYFDDDAAPGVRRFAETVFSDFDGLGHYRTVTTRGNFQGENDRTTTTNYNPDSGEYSDPFDSFIPPATSAPWLLETFDQRDIEERELVQGKETFRETFCFDSVTGFLKRRRMFLETGATPVERAKDVIVEYTPLATGNLQFERYYGGDKDPTSASSNLCGLSLSAPQYEIEHQYDFGARRLTRYVDPAGNLKLFEHTIDPSTGLVASTEDAAGVEIDYDYDRLGRRTDEKPAPGHGAWVKYIYRNADGADEAQVDIIRRVNGGGADFAEDRVFFDGLGRVMDENRRLPSGLFNSRRTFYDPVGWRAAVSETEPVVSPSNFTIFSEYDPFGRPGRITPPDGSSHDVVLRYRGDSRVSRTVWVEGEGEEFQSTTIEIYDRFGRLRQVLEPAAPNEALVATTYTYDGANRLRRVFTNGPEGPQERLFEYDGRGFLLSETHPEKGTNGNGSVDHAMYDARGHVGRKTDGGLVDPTANDLQYIYDRKERLVAVETFNPGGSGIPLKGFAYGTANNLSKGKLVAATRHNYTPKFGGQDFQITETYEHEGVGGRVSRKTTQRDGFNWFDQEFTWTDLGDVRGVFYPVCLVPGECEGGGNPSGEPDLTVTHRYMNGFLTSLVHPGFGTNTAITYHENEMIASIRHGNGVIDNHVVDPHFMRRPGRIFTDGVVGGAEFNPGIYRYDGAGNIKSIGADTFTYDAVSRLTQGTSVAGTFSETSTYDVFGNRIEAETSGIGWRAIPTDPSTNRLLGTPERPVTYDSRGNQTQWGSALYAYDGFDQMTIHEDLESGLDQSFIYTADDERIVVIENDVPSETWYLRDLNGQVLRKYFRLTGDTTWLKDTIHRQGQVLATDTGGDIRHAHVDHLGTIRLWTREGGAFHSRHNYTAFGEEIVDQPTGEDFRYTGHERDIARSGACFTNAGVNGQTLESGETFVACADLISNNTVVTSSEQVTFRAGDMVRLGNGFTIDENASFVAEIDGMLNSDLQDLDYMHARHCSPVQGRFLATDPARASADPLSPQSWNRYAYALNNPTRFIDPDGRAPIDPGADRPEIDLETALVLNAMIVAPVAVPVGAKLAFAAPAALPALARAFPGLTSMFLNPRAQQTAAEIVSSFADDLANGGAGSSVTVVSQLDNAIDAGRALSTATGDGALALASAARSGGRFFKATLPKALVDRLEEAGLVRRSVTEMKGKRAVELRFNAEAMKELARFFDEFDPK